MAKKAGRSIIVNWKHLDRRVTALNMLLKTFGLRPLKLVRANSKQYQIIGLGCIVGNVESREAYRFIQGAWQLAALFHRLEKGDHSIIIDDDTDLEEGDNT